MEVGSDEASTLLNHDDEDKTLKKTTHASKLSVAFNVFGIICYPLSIPYAFGQSGWISCYLGFLFAAISTYGNAHLLGEICVHRPDLNSYPEIAYAAYGLNASRLTNTLQWIGFYLLSVYNLVLLGEYFSMLFPSLCQNEWVPTIASILVVFLQIPSYEELSWLAIIFFFIVMLSLVFIIEQSIVGKYCDVKYTDLSFYTIVNGFTAFAFSFGGSGMFPEVISEMEKKSEFLGFNGSLSLAYYAIIPSYLLAGTIAFVAFGNDASGNIVEDFPSGFIRNFSLILLSLMVSFNLLESNQLLCKKLEKILNIDPLNWTSPSASTFSFTDQPGVQRAVVRVTMLLSQVFFAEMLYSAGVGDLQSLVGALAGIPLSFILPMIFHYKLIPKSLYYQNIFYKSLFLFSLLISLCFTFFGSYVAIYSIVTGIDDYTLFGGTCTVSIDNENSRCSMT